MENATFDLASPFLAATMETWTDQGSTAVAGGETAAVGASDWIDIVCRPVIVCVGLAGNAASLVVMTSRKLRARSTSVYFATLAVADTLCLLQRLVDQVMSRGLGLTIFDYPDAACKVERFVLFFAFLWSAWIVVCVTIERFIVTCFPFHAKSLCTAKVARVNVTLITAVLAAFWLPVVFADGVGGGLCDLVPFYARLMAWGMWVSTALYSYLPTVLLVGCNLTIITVLARSSKTLTGQKDHANLRATRTALTVSVIYLLLTLPSVTFITVNFTGGVRLDAATFALINMIMNELVLANHAVNFFIYVLTSAAFREQLRATCRGGAGAAGKDAARAEKSPSAGDMGFAETLAGSCAASTTQMTELEM